MTMISICTAWLWLHFITKLWKLQDTPTDQKTGKQIWAVGPRLVDRRVLSCAFRSFVWCDNAHVTLLMYVLLHYAWGGVGVGQWRSCYAAHVRGARSRMGWGWGGAITFMSRSAFTLTFMLCPAILFGVSRMIQQWIWRQVVFFLALPKRKEFLCNSKALKELVSPIPLSVEAAFSIGRDVSFAKSDRSSHHHGHILSQPAVSPGPSFTCSFFPWVFSLQSQWLINFCLATSHQPPTEFLSYLVSANKQPGCLLAWCPR